MMNQSLRVALVLCALSVSAAAQLVEEPARVARPGAQLVADGIPTLPRAQRADQAEPQLLRFVDWHPVRAEMLVLARTGTRTQLHRLTEAMARPQVLTSGSDAVASARWEPSTGEYLVFSQDQGGNESYRLFRLSPGETPVALSAADARVSDYAFLPQGRGLVYLLEQLDRHAQNSRESHTALMWTDPLHPEKSRQLAQVRGGRFTALRVAGNGAIVLTRTLGGRSQLMRYGLDGAEPRALGAATPAPGSSDDEDALWSRQAVVGEYRHLLRIDTERGARRNLLVDQTGDLEAVAAAPASARRPLAVSHNENGVSVLRLFDARDEKAPARRIDDGLPPGVIQTLGWHPTLPLLAFNHVSAQNPGRIYVHDVERDTRQAWSGAALVAQGADYKALRWKSFDGLEISGLHIAPPARFTGPRPVYISIHGGPSSQSRPGYLSGTNRHLVEEMGMHLILPNVRGSDGFGKRFLILDNGRRREDSVKDISALLDLIATREEMDASRVIVSGGSYGGYMALAVAVHESARIAGSICRVGIANFVSFLENTESYRRDNRRLEYGDERDPAMREFLQKISPLSSADKVRKPLFVVHGRNDPRVPYGEAQQMVKAVRAQNTPVWFLTAEDEGHSFTSTANREYLFHATVEFVRRALAGEPMNSEPR